MTQQLLDDPDRHPRQHQARGEGVPQIVEAEGQDVRPIHRPAPGDLLVALARPRVGVREDVEAARVAHLGLEHPAQDRVDQQVARALRLGVPGANEALLGIDVLPLQLQDLFLAHARVRGAEDDRRFFAGVSPGIGLVRPSRMA